MNTIKVPTHDIGEDILHLTRGRLPSEFAAQDVDGFQIHEWQTVHNALLGLVEEAQRQATTNQSV